MTDWSSEIAARICDAADLAIVPRFRALTAAEVVEKSPGDFVTDADHECEEMLTSALNEIEPGVPVIGEEAAASDPRLLDKAHQHERVWVVDPLDGTRSFIDGSPDFATMVALVERNVVTASWIWQPMHTQMFTAELGRGATHRGSRLSEPAEPLQGRSGWTGVLRTRMMPAKLRAAALAGFASAGLEHTHVAAAGIVYPMAATGLLTHALYWRTLPWDHAPGSLLAREVGMTVARLDGSEYRPFDDRYGVLTAVNATVWESVRGALPEQLPDSSTS